MATPSTGSFQLAQQVVGMGNPLFNFGPDTAGVFGTEVPKMTPKTGIVDVYNNMSWRYRSSPADLEVPQLILNEYEVIESRSLQNIDTIFSDITNRGIKSLADAYKSLYIGNATGFVYNIPWLFAPGDSFINLEQNWGEYGSEKLFPNITGSTKPGDNKSGSSKWDAAFSIAKEAIGGMSGGSQGFDSVAFFSNTKKRSIQVSFPLFNTVSPKQSYINYCFTLLLAFQNMMTRTSLLTFRPPKLYQVSTSHYGGVFMPVAYLNNINIQSIGTTRVLKEFSEVNSAANSHGILIPEAYKISFTIQEALPLSTNIYAATFGGKQVNVITDSVIGGLAAGTSNAVANVANATSNIVQSLLK